MKIFVTFVIVTSICSILSTAHPGKTDENGGHWDRTAGTYHYHTGEYAGKSSSGISSSSNDVYFTPSVDTPKKTYRKDKADSNNSNTENYIIISLIAAGGAILYLIKKGK